MEIEVGDVVLVKVKVFSKVFSLEGASSVFYGENLRSKFNVAFSRGDVHSVLERAETDAEKIARLEARVRELETALPQGDENKMGKFLDLCRLPDA